MSKTSAAPLSERQWAVLIEMAAYRQSSGRYPSVMHLAEKLSCHHSTIQQHLDYAHRKGFLRGPVPGPLLRPIPSLVPRAPMPIPERDEDDREPATVEQRMVTAPGLPEPAVVELRTMPGQSRPSEVIVRTRTVTAHMTVERKGGPDGPITGFAIVKTVEG